MIHTLGDSHSHSGFEGIANYVNHHIGPILCFTYGNRKTEILNFRATNPPIVEGDKVIVSLGEIDCRCHVHKHTREYGSYTGVISHIVANYFKAISENIAGFNIRMSVYNVVPPVRSSMVVENPAYPFLGSDHERLLYTQFFNELLRENCRLYGYLFFDIYDHYADKDGFLKKEISDGSVHIADGTFIKKFIDKNLGD